MQIFVQFEHLHFLLNLRENYDSLAFLCKKKQEIYSLFLQKTGFLKFAPKRWLTVLFSKKLAFFLLKKC